ncbi:MAG: YbaY family lipoprotein [Shewanella sp.]|uniref:YbaY family lipoprotein n=1 Tax=Shewanella sp. SNU WT4 TaxID=2590015 RepID=UPI00112778A3|nr:YbaY family lipoprotein [Shewanella sp. SNU WT4]QDF66567.1 chaperone for general secretion pathway YbaY [Shewanella sp. SNU WT4]
MKKYFASVLLLVSSLVLSGCVTVEPPQPVVINGAAGYLEKISLPPGSVINIAIIDFNTPGSIIAQKNFNVARVPVPFKFLLPADSIKSNINYGVVAMIQYQGQVLFQTYDKYPVINNDKFTTEVIMKPVYPNQP